MGLFSFLKNVGSSVFKSKAEDNDAAAADISAANAKKAGLLEDIINSHGLAIDNLSITFENDLATIYGQTECLDDKEKVILIVGNVEGVATVDDRISVVTPPQSTFYEVQSGDSLSKIAKSYYGDPMKYNAIFEANKPMLKDPDEIYPGQKLRIPAL